MTVTMKLARSALPVTLAHWERAGVRGMGMAAATYILWGGADAMAVSWDRCGEQPGTRGKSNQCEASRQLQRRPSICAEGTISQKWTLEEQLPCRQRN
jgi:hypothetical protein